MFARIAEEMKNDREDLDKTTSRSHLFSNSTWLQSIADLYSKLVVYLLWWLYRKQIATDFLFSQKSTVRCSCIFYVLLGIFDRHAELFMYLFFILFFCRCSSTALLVP